MATTTQAPNPHTPQTSQPRNILTLAGIWIALLTLVFIGSHSTAHAGDGAITGLTLTSDSPGVLTINWTAASPIPTDYRVVWAESSSGFKSWKDESGNAFPTANAHTISELDDDLEYKARVRSRYFDSEGKRQKSGPWSEVVVLNLALPRKPTGILTLASSNQVVLLWDSNDDSITGYRIHRGADPDSLEVLVEDTGNPRTDYTDIAVSPGTSYTYAIQAINGEGVSDLSDHVSESTEPDENLQSAGQEEIGQTLVSTIEQPSHFGFALDSTVSSEPSIMFLKIITGDNSDGYRLDGVKVRLKRVSGSSVPKVSIRLGSICPVARDDWKTLENPSNFSALAETERTFTAYFTAPEDITLRPDRAYWIALAETSDDAEYYPVFTESGDIDDGAAQGWSVGEGCLVSGDGNLRGIQVTGLSNKRLLAVIAQAISTP